MSLSARDTSERLDRTRDEPRETFEIRGRYNNLLATAETLEIAKRDVLYRIGTLHQSGVYVERVTVHREVAYRPRLVTVAGS